MSPTLPHVLFDMYGVLMRLPTEAELRRVQTAAGWGEEMWPVYWDLRPDLDAGRVSDVAYWQQIAARLGERPADLDVHEVIAADYVSCLRSQDEVVAVARELQRAGHLVGVLSNISTTLAGMVRERHEGWLRDFDAVTFSCEAGAAKPERRVYEAAVAALGAEPNDTLFVDDREDYLEGAREAGLRTHLFRGVAGLRRELGLPDAGE